MAEDQTETDYLRSRGYMPPAEIESQRTANTQKLEDISSREIDVIKGVRDERMKLAGTPTPRPGPPKLQELPGSPEVPQTDPFKVFQNPAVLLATLGSMFTRAPLTSAMNAGAAAMEAQRKGDIQTFELQQKKWHDETERAKEHNANELTKYNALWQNARMSMEEKLAKMNALAAGEKDEVLIAAIQSGQVDRLDKVLDARQKANEQLELALVRSRAAQQKQDQKAEEQKAKVETVVNQIDAAMKLIEKGGKEGKSVAGLGGTMNRYGELVLPGNTDANEFEQLITTIKMGLPPLIRGSTRALGADKGELDKIVPGLTPFKNTQTTYNELAQLKRILSKKEILNQSPSSGGLESLSDEDLRKKAIELGIDPDSL